MVLPHPFHKRLMARAVFYGGVMAYLWVAQFTEHSLIAKHQAAQAPVAVAGR